MIYWNQRLVLAEYDSGINIEAVLPGIHKYYFGAGFDDSEKRVNRGDENWLGLENF